ncbi:MAG: S8 family serine peptidase [Oligoflexia bacterium]|nr:S8 family serine peptidase [Oligoflexia bacterium]
MQVIKKNNFIILSFALLSLILIISNFLFLTKAYGSLIAVIDSGVDTSVDIIRDHLWVNKYDIPYNSIDDDDNGYIDDIFGWNFIDNNNLVIDDRYQGLFNSDHKLFFDIQSKITYATATVNEILWIKQKLNDKKFMKKIKTLGTYIHGTHVAGIAVNDTTENKIQTIKMISTKGSPNDEDDEDENNPVSIEDLPLPPEVQRDCDIAIARGISGINLVKYVLSKIISRQMETMKLAVKYADQTGVQVANASFGTGYTQGKMMATIFFRVILKRFPTSEELTSVTDYFFNQLSLKGKSIFSSANKTLFVFAAGNEGISNDIYPSTPANLKLENTISVAAWMGPSSNREGALAHFSNFGQKKVEVAAPGVGIVSTIPGNKYATLSGTSQAAPFVSNIAGEILNINPQLSPSEVKEIIIKTVDYKAALKGKVTSSGVVNKSRAVLAATYSKRYSLSQAIDLAIAEIKSFPTDNLNSRIRSRITTVIPQIYKDLQYVNPLPSEFKNVLDKYVR